MLCVGVGTSLSERCTRVEQSDETNVTHGTYEGAISPLFASCDGWRKEEARLVVVARGLIEKRAK